MSDYFRQIWEPLSKLSRGKQIGLGILVLAVIIGVATVSMWSTEKTYIPLFDEQLKIEDASKITSLLTQENIQYKLGKNATEILVPIEEKSRIMLKLAENDTLPQANPGWEKLIDQRSMFSGTTKEEFDLNITRCLQSELERLYKSMKGIKDAHVILNKPKKQLFEEDQKEPSASIVLTLDPLFQITPDQIRTIRRLTATAIEGLEPDNVAISDTESRDLTRLIEDDEDNSEEKLQDKRAAIQKNRENMLTKKLTKHLAKIFGGPDKVVCSINLEMDFDELESVTDRAIPLPGTEKGVLISEKSEKEEYKGTDMINGGEPGVNSNLRPGAPSYPGDDGGLNYEYKRSGDIKNYDITKSKEKFKKEQGQIKRMTAAISIDDDPEKLRTIRDLVESTAQNTIGYKKDRGDKLSLMVYPFRHDDQLSASAAAQERREQEKTMFKIVVGLFMAIPLFIGLIYLFVRAAKGRALAREEARLREAADEAIKARKAREDEIARRNKAQWLEWELRYEDIKNYYPEIVDFEEKKQKVQDMRLAAYIFARDNDAYPYEYEEMRPEEQYTYKKAFEFKKEGTLEKNIERLETVIEERNQRREKELKELDSEANAREKLEARVLELVREKPEDTVQVIRAWLGKAN